MISKKDLLMGRDREYPLTAELEQNLMKLVEAIQKLEVAYGKPFSVSSGYRPGWYNRAAGGAPGSAHMLCEAVDLHDRDNSIKKWITEDILTKYDLYMEDPDKTLTWIHLQVRPTHSRIFKI